jgi:hypothetical protein
MSNKQRKKVLMSKSNISNLMSGLSRNQSFQSMTAEERRALEKSLQQISDLENQLLQMATPGVLRKVTELATELAKATAPEPKFWVVWSPTGSNPSVRHSSEMSAENEANRLRSMYPHRKFYVMEMVEEDTVSVLY